MFHLLHHHAFERVIALDINSRTHSLCYQDRFKPMCRRSSAELRTMRDRYPGHERARRAQGLLLRLSEAIGTLLSATFSHSRKVSRSSEQRQTIFLNRTCFKRPLSCELRKVISTSPSAPTRIHQSWTRKICSMFQRAFRTSSFTMLSTAMSCISWARRPSFTSTHRIAPLTTSSSFTAYSKGGFNDENQEQLADLCRQLDKNGVRFMLSNSDPKNADEEDQFFDDLYDGFRIDRVEANRAINSKGSGRGKITEISGSKL